MVPTVEALAVLWNRIVPADASAAAVQPFEFRCDEYQSVTVPTSSFYSRVMRHSFVSPAGRPLPT
jgi:hypothetical protein